MMNYTFKSRMADDIAAFLRLKRVTGHDERERKRARAQMKVSTEGSAFLKGLLSTREASAKMHIFAKD